MKMLWRNLQGQAHRLPGHLLETEYVSIKQTLYKLLLM